VSKLKIAVLVSGSGSNLQALIDATASGSIEGQIEIVISDRPDAYALQRAEKHGITAICIDRKMYMNKSEFDLQLMNSLNEVKPDLIILAGYLSILSPELIDKYRGKIINIHPSLLPAFGGKGFYGEKVHKAVIESGTKVSGATVHFVDENTDAGPIILQKAVVVLYSDTPETLAKRILSIEHSLMVKAVELFCKKRLKLEGRKVRILKER
jgi:phosphoribosylglycinamide formyltransferase-1